jgi:hypothetical protein
MVNTDTHIPADIIGYELIDGVNQVVGTIDSIWNGTDGSPEFAGVHIGMIAGTHLIPLSVARINPEARQVRVDAMADTITNTRHFKPGDDLSSQDRWETYDEWGLEAPEGGAPTPYHADLQAGNVEGESFDTETGVNPV